MNPLEPYVPDDFDAFWTEAVAEAERAPLDYRRHPQSDVAGAPKRCGGGQRHC